MCQITTNKSAVYLVDNNETQFGQFDPLLVRKQTFEQNKKIEIVISFQVSSNLKWNSMLHLK